mmetsp:Transcript_54944/g.131259  ORF Transcript_54944/g.131259 Transcript_54944/m.131259 type:complete len:333 (-) Transcript_54944:89-1087(-)
MESCSSLGRLSNQGAFCSERLTKALSNCSATLLPRRLASFSMSTHTTVQSVAATKLAWRIEVAPILRYSSPTHPPCSTCLMMSPPSSFPDTRSPPWTRLRLPDFTRYRRLHSSPASATTEPAVKVSFNNAAAPTFSFCLLDSPAKICTRSKSRRFLAWCLSACSRTRCRKKLPPRAQTPAASLALTVAVRGTLYSSAMQPKAQPLRMVLATRPFTVTSRQPASVMNRLSPSSPCRTMISPGSKEKYSSREHSAFKTSSSRCRQNRLFLMLSETRAFVASSSSRLRFFLRSRALSGTKSAFGMGLRKHFRFLTAAEAVLSDSEHLLSFASASL